MRGKILITDDLHPLLSEGLDADGYDVEYRPDISSSEVLKIIPDYEGLIINSKVFVGKEFLDRASALKFVGRAGSGLEVIDLDYAKQRGVVVFNSPEGNRNAVGEHALGMLLNLMNNISLGNCQVRNHEWKREENRGHELSGKTVGLIAYGNTAQAFVKLLSGFGVRILAYDKYFHNFSAGPVKEATMEEIYAESDILSLHLPLSRETTYMIDYNYMCQFKKKYWLLNTSRGKVMRTVDLMKCLAEGKIWGAGLDVLENENINRLEPDEKRLFEQLIADKRILLTPHIAGWTHESKQKIADVLLGKIRALDSVSA